MGIPKFYTHTIRKYKNVMKGLDFFTHSDNKIHVLCFDANSIIYDTLSKMEKEAYAGIIEDELIMRVINKIVYYIELIEPTQRVYISFDGIPPRGKVKQQLKRRALQHILRTPVTYWDRNNITLGKPFMNKFTAKIDDYFGNYKDKMRYVDFVCSSPKECGEGEHKIMDYIRSNDFSDKNVLIYGLDSDLIMLSLLVHNRCKSLHVCREIEHFMKQYIHTDYETTDDIYAMDIKYLSRLILRGMGTDDEVRIKDYVVLCYIFGNDFIDRQYIIDDRIYNVLMSKYTNRIVNDDDTINFSEFNKLINNDECKRIINVVLTQEYERRQNKKRMLWKDARYKKTDELIQNISQMYVYMDNRKGITNENTKVDEVKYREVWNYYMNGVDGCDSGEKMDIIEYNKEMSTIMDVKLSLKEWSKHMWECEMAK